ncbi:MAG: ribonuclease HII [Arcanobacterium sp.]|nr:ribonuclease HII [Arcanobacterium sp.]MDY5589473.1 ribonuclease HII [Arcanobacterium sp.]
MLGEPLPLSDFNEDQIQPQSEDQIQLQLPTAQGRVAHSGALRGGSQPLSSTVPGSVALQTGGGASQKSMAHSAARVPNRATETRVPSRTIEKEWLRELASAADKTHAVERAEQRSVGHRFIPGVPSALSVSKAAVGESNNAHSWVSAPSASGAAGTAAHDSVVLAGVDEVGRGALAGPVSVGIAAITAGTSDSFPAGLRDSKLLTPARREALIEPCERWVHAWAVGSASAAEIDQYGIIAALRIAAARAAHELWEHGVRIDGVLLDGTHNWWSPVGLFELDAAGAPLSERTLEPPDVPVRTVVKGDAQCAVVAAASVLAKVVRDAYMVELAQRYPGYSFERNKGYASAAHVRALERLGPSEIHRTSWHLPGVK